MWLRSGGKRSDPELAVEVRRETLRSSVCSCGPAGNTLIQSLLFGSRGPLQSSACSKGPAGNALTLSLLFGSGGERCDLALAVEDAEEEEKEAGQLTCGGHKS